MGNRPVKLLFIEDDRAVGNILVETLTAHHWIVDRATDGQGGLELAEAQDYDLILLDIGLPKLDGISVCKRLRSQGYGNPILLLTEKDSIDDQVAGLDAGADDYVVNPFNVDALLARMRAVVQRGRPTSSIMTWENVQLDSVTSEVTCDETLVRLTPKEYCLLELFMLNPKRIFSRRAILDRLWDFADSPGEETISTHVKCLQQKLKAAGASDPVETVHGLGYRLRSPQTISPPDPVEQAAASASKIVPVPDTTQQVKAITTKVWDRFKGKYEEQATTLEQQVAALATVASSVTQQEAEQIAHKLAGSLGMFGLMNASHLAHQVEQLVNGHDLSPIQIQEAIRLTRLLRQEVERSQTETPLQLQESHP